MQGSLGQPPIIIRSSRLVTAGLLLIVAGFTVTGVMMARDPEENPVIAYFVAGFFALGIPIFAWRLIRPDTITLTPDGITWHSIFRNNHWNWSEVQDFHVYTPPARWIAKYVGFVFTGSGAPGEEPNTGTFGSGWELGAAELADLLNKARGLWLRSRK